MKYQVVLGRGSIRQVECPGSFITYGQQQEAVGCLGEDVHARLTSCAETPWWTGARPGTECHTALLTQQHLFNVTDVRSCHNKGATRIPAARNCREIVSQHGWSATLHRPAARGVSRSRGHAGECHGGERARTVTLY